jgi:hypothetical protein
MSPPPGPAWGGCSTRASSASLPGSPSDGSPGLIADRFADTDLVLWPFAVGGMVLGVTLVRWISTRKSGRGWVHALWIPVVLFVGLMTLIILALRALN